MSNDCDTDAHQQGGKESIEMEASTNSTISVRGQDEIIEMEPGNTDTTTNGGQEESLELEPNIDNQIFIKGQEERIEMEAGTNPTLVVQGQEESIEMEPNINNTISLQCQNESVEMELEPNINNRISIGEPRNGFTDSLAQPRPFRLAPPPSPARCPPSLLPNVPTPQKLLTIKEVNRSMEIENINMLNRLIRDGANLQGADIPDELFINLETKEETGTGTVLLTAIIHNTEETALELINRGARGDTETDSDYNSVLILA